MFSKSKSKTKNEVKLKETVDWCVIGDGDDYTYFAKTLNSNGPSEFHSFIFENNVIHFLGRYYDADLFKGLNAKAIICIGITKNGVENLPAPRDCRVFTYNQNLMTPEAFLGECTSISTEEAISIVKKSPLPVVMLLTSNNGKAKNLTVFNQIPKELRRIILEKFIELHKKSSFSEELTLFKSPQLPPAQLTPGPKNEKCIVS